MEFKLPDLEYSYDALEPYIDATTMEIHHQKHHFTYVNNLNKALENFEEWKGKNIEYILKNLESIPKEIYWSIRNNGGAHYNHSLFWKMISPNGGTGPNEELLEKINERFGDFEGFKEKFAKAALTRFGSGWAWLVMDKEKKIFVTSTLNQDTPLSLGNEPLLCLDVWEHAYYLKYKNRRADYVKEWWNVVNWNYVNARFDELK